jgi:hypothetical protein
MPATSKRQFRAMQAAAHGKSTLGIPKKVGKEFADATKSPKSLPETKKPKKGKAFQFTK